MAATKTLEDIQTKLAEFSTEVEKIRTSPAAVEEAFEQAVKMVSTAEGATFGGIIGGAIGYGYASITGDAMFTDLKENEEEIKRLIAVLLDKLQTAIDALQAPIAFLNASTEWLSLQTPINQARNYPLNKGNLIGTWSGAAADEYRATRDLQIIGFDTASGICDTESDALGAISDAAWAFYSGIVEDLLGYGIDFTAAIAKIATGVGAPFGADDLIDVLGQVAKDVVKHGDNLVVTLSAQVKNINKMASAIDNPKSFLNDKWPSGGSKNFWLDSPNSERWAAR